MHTKPDLCTALFSYECLEHWRKILLKNHLSKKPTFTLIFLNNIQQDGNLFPNSQQLNEMG
jgi:hypothetical protein